MSKVLFVASPTLNSFVDKKKGTTGNKFDCAGHHFANACKYNVAMSATMGLAGAIGYAKAKSVLPGGFLKNAAAIIKAVPTPIKVIATGVTAVLLAMKHHNIGKIEQTYIDRAEFMGDVDRSNKNV